MADGYRVAILGATGVVGQELLKTLIERKFPVSELKLLASARSAGKEVACGGRTYRIEEATPEAFEGIDLVLASAGGAVSAELAPQAVKAGAVVVDNTSHFRMHPNVPLVVPEVNPEALDAHQGIVANPNCSTAQLVVVLHALQALAPIRRVVVSTYQSVSGAGKEAMDELLDHTRAALEGKEPVPDVFQHPMGFNLIPQIDVFQDNGYTKEEMKMTQETQKILGQPDFRLTATAVRVPVLVGHSEAVNIEFESPVTVEAARELLARTPGVELVDAPETFRYPMPRDCAGTDPVYVGRLRGDVSHENALNMWVVADNLRKGAALNAVQIAEALHERQLLRRPTAV